MVFGVEADLGLGRFVGDDSQAAGRINEIEINALATLRGRLGWAADNLLVYGTAGLAAASFAKREAGDPPIAAQLATGWTAGGGAELALDEHWRVRAEYLHIRPAMSRHSSRPATGTAPMPHRSICCAPA